MGRKVRGKKNGLIGVAKQDQTKQRLGVYGGGREDKTFGEIRNRRGINTQTYAERKRKLQKGYS